MGVLKGNITFQKLYVRGALPADLHQVFLARIRARGFKQLTPEDEDDVAVGWVPIERPFDEEISFRSEGVFFGSYVNLAMRIDRWKFPAALVKARMAQAERAYRQKTNKERISKVEKAELREAVERKLRRDGVPTTSTSELSWSLETGELRFFSKSRVHFEYLIELFEKTFGLRLLPNGAFVAAVATGSLLSELDEVEPALLHLGGGQ